MFSFQLSKLNRIFDISKSCAKTFRNIVIYDTINASFLSPKIVCPKLVSASALTKFWYANCILLPCYAIISNNIRYIYKNLKEYRKI